MINLDDLKQEIEKYCDVNFVSCASFKDMTSFKSGGECLASVSPKNTQSLVLLIKLLKEKDIPYIILGNGSNTLASDNGYRRVVVQTVGLKEICLKDGVIVADCGAQLTKLSSFAYENGICGFEFLYGIPGTVGGGIYMNAGAFGGEIKDVLLGVSALNKSGRAVFIKAEELKLSYRKSIFMDEEYIILCAHFGCKSGNKADIREKMDGYMKIRRKNQPLEYASAGSTFKRPQPDELGNPVYAGRLIEECGLKGKNVGDAFVSEKHAGFIVNKGNAKSSEITELINIVKKEVYEKKGVRLECEIRFIGE